MESDAAAFEKLAASVGAGFASTRKYVVLEVPPEKVAEACRSVARQPGYYHLSTITAMDLGKEVALMYHFWRGRGFAVVKTKVPKEKRVIESVVKDLPAATLYEAEISDLFGVTFEGNPMTGMRLLLPDTYPKDAPPPLTKEADPEKIRKMMELE
jgi:NADH:ubiquinone oxidoreductase subunit C